MKNPIDGSLYCVQLVISVLNRGEIEAEEDLVQTVKAMMSWRPERIMNFLMITPGTEYNPAGMGKGGRLPGTGKDYSRRY